MDNPFKKIFSEGLAYFQSGASSDSVVGIDIGSSSIKAVQLKKKGGKALIETYGAIALGPYAQLEVGQTTNLPVEQLAVAVRDVMRESGITTNNGAFSIPSSGSLVFLIELPGSIKEDQLPTIIPTEARKYIPVPVSEVSLDWWVIPRKDASSYDDMGQPVEAKIEVLVVAIQNDVVSKYKDVVKRADVTAGFFEIEIFSQMRATIGHDLSPVLIIDFGASKTKLTIVEYGIARYSHVINRGSHDISNTLCKSLNVTFGKAEEMKREFGMYGSPTDKNISEIIKLSVDYVLSETNNVVLNYERKYNKVISKVILSGGGSMLKGFPEAAKDAFRAEVVLANPFSKVEAPAFLAPVLESVGPEFAVALGLAIRKLQQ